MSQIRQITEIGILTAMITILGAIKIPNLVPGIEFQLSAPSSGGNLCSFWI